MKQVILVNVTAIYIDNDTCQPVQLTDNEKLLSSVYPSKYSFAQLYTPLVKLKAKTFKELDLLVNKYAVDNNFYDFHTIIIK